MRMPMTEGSKNTPDARDVFSPKRERKHAGDKTTRSPVFVEFFFNILGSIRLPLLVLDSDLHVVKANRYYYLKFATSPAETEGKSFFDLGRRQWDVKNLKESFARILIENAVINDFECDQHVGGIGPRVMRLNAGQILYRKSGLSPLVLLSI